MYTRWKRLKKREKVERDEKEVDKEGDCNFNFHVLAKVEKRRRGRGMIKMED
jgi:hypothetical protein